jgi:hypothetical protein
MPTSDCAGLARPAGLQDRSAATDARGVLLLPLCAADLLAPLPRAEAAAEINAGPVFRPVRGAAAPGWLGLELQQAANRAERGLGPSRT